MRFLIFITALAVLYLITAFLVWDINLFTYLEESLGYRIFGLVYIVLSFIIAMQDVGVSHEDYP